MPISPSHICHHYQEENLHYLQIYPDSYLSKRSVRLLLSDDILSHIVLLAQVEHLSNFARSLGSQGSGLNNVSQTWDISLSFPDDLHAKDT